jgi:hypothetical protein
MVRLGCLQRANASRDLMRNCNPLSALSLQGEEKQEGACRTLGFRILQPVNSTRIDGGVSSASRDSSTTRTVCDRPVAHDGCAECSDPPRGGGAEDRW